MPIFGVYWTKKFSDIWETDESFYEEWNTLGPFRGCFASEESSIKKIFWLLTAKYKNSIIANFDEGQFRLKVWSLIFQYGPVWEKRLEYQEKIRSLTEEELQTASKSISNHAFNPSTPASTEELQTVDDQNTNYIKRGKLEAYLQATEYLDEDFTQDFIDRFKDLFLKIVEPQEPLLYEGEE